MTAMSRHPLPLAMSLAPAEFATFCANALQAEVAFRPNPVALCAEASNSNEATAKNHLRGRNAPGGLHLLRYMTALPGFDRSVRRIMVVDDGAHLRWLATIPGFVAEVCRITGDSSWWLPEYEQVRQQVAARLGNGRW